MSEGTCRVPLYGKGGQAKAWLLVDDGDFYAALEWRWHINSSGYAIRLHPNDGPDREVVFLHRAIMGLAKGDAGVVDHINGDRLDNRRANLRVVTAAANAQNRRSRSGSTSEFRGVCWDQRKGCWHASGSLGGTKHFLGYFDDEEEAGRVAREWRRQHMPFASS